MKGSRGRREDGSWIRFRGVQGACARAGVSSLPEQQSGVCVGGVPCEDAGGVV